MLPPLPPMLPVRLIPATKAESRPPTRPPAVPLVCHPGVGIADDPDALYSAMHAYLSSSGVDGVKVDCQAGVGLVGSCLGGGPAAARRFQAALENSIAQHFPGNHAINCMCHSSENFYRWVRVGGWSCEGGVGVVLLGTGTGVGRVHGAVLLGGWVGLRRSLGHVHPWYHITNGLDTQHTAPGCFLLRCCCAWPSLCRVTSTALIMVCCCCCAWHWAPTGCLDMLLPLLLPLPPNTPTPTNTPIQTRRFRDTAVARVSDDFYPRDPASSTPHIGACAYNTMYLGALVQPDWDMFQSAHPAGGCRRGRRDMDWHGSWGQGHFGGEVVRE
jgi:hypothetical protein